MKNLLILLLTLVCTIGFSQVGIGTTNPDPSSALDITSTDKGMLVPRVSLVNVTNATTPIASPAESLLVWNTNATVVGGSGVGFYYFRSGNWIPLSTGNNLDQAYDEGGAGVGRSITADTGALRIDGDDGVLVTGTFGSGAVPEISGAGTRLFFNPRKAAFRAGNVEGTQWDDVNIGDYSFATNRSTTASGTNSFAANQLTVASGLNASAFGISTVALGDQSFAIGRFSTASNTNAFATGNTTMASGVNSFTSGENSIAPSINEVAIGSFPTTYTLTNASTSPNTFFSTDRAFVVGIGTGPGNLKNALEVWKDGRTIINEAYTLPTTDGTTDQIIKTDGAGVLSWVDGINTNVVSHAIYASDANFTVTDINAADDPTNIDVTGYDSVILPTEYNPTGEIQIKLVVRLSAYTGSPLFRIRAHNGTTGSNATNFANPQTYTATNTGGVLTTDWINWSAGTVPQEIKVQGRTNNGESFTVTSAYVLIKSQ